MRRDRFTLGWIISIRFLSIEADSPPSYVVSASQVLEFILYKLVISIVPKISTTNYLQTYVKIELKSKDRC